MKSQTRKKRILYFDLIRTISMLFVVGVLHFSQYTEYYNWYKSYLAEALTGISLSCFTFISGYFAYHSYKNNKTISFLIGRIIRIYPLFAISALLLYIIGDISGREQLVFTLLGNAGCLFGQSPRTLWYVCMLFMFYVVTPLVLKDNNLLRCLVRGALFLIVFTLIIFFTDGDIRVIKYYPAYLLGLVMPNMKEEFHNKCWQYSGKIGFRSNKRLLQILLLIIETFIVTILFFVGYEVKGYIKLIVIILINLTSLALLFSIAIPLSVHINNNAKNIGNAIYFISYASFCMYLFHRVVYHIIQELLFGGGGGYVSYQVLS